MLVYVCELLIILVIGLNFGTNLDKVYLGMNVLVERLPGGSQRLVGEDVRSILARTYGI